MRTMLKPVLFLGCLGLFMLSTPPTLAAGPGDACESATDCTEDACADSGCTCPTPPSSVANTCQVVRDYCWCVRPDGVCENHRDDAAGGPIRCRGAGGTTSCTAYCNDRGPGWEAAQCDETFINRSTSSTGEVGSRRCPRVSETPSEPAGGPGPDTGPSTEPIQLFNPLGSDITIPQFIGRGIRAVIGIVGALALLMFIYGGIVWMTAGGSQERITSAKNILKNSFIGLLLIFFSYTIISIFFSVLGG